MDFSNHTNIRTLHDLERISSVSFFMGKKDKNKKDEDKDFVENFEKFDNKENNKWLRNKKKKNKKAYTEDLKDKRWN